MTDDVRARLLQFMTERMGLDASQRERARRGVDRMTDLDVRQTLEDLETTMGALPNAVDVMKRAIDEQLRSAMAEGRASYLSPEAPIERVGSTRPKIEHWGNVVREELSLQGVAASSSEHGDEHRSRWVGPGDRVGRYQLGDELGAGGMAAVFRARDVELGRDVAVKVLSPQMARWTEVTRRFQREARAAAALEHQNILRVYDVGGGELDDPPFIVMELVRGRSLRDVADARGPLLAELVAAIGALMCDALTVAHAAGIFHRDIRPDNIMLGNDGRLLLADFGLTRVGDADSPVLGPGKLLGTPAFMSPEQTLGESVDARSDLYALGVTLYKLATGSLPYGGAPADVVVAASRGSAQPAVRRRPAVGGELSQVIESLMAPDPAHRPATTAAAASLRKLTAAGGLEEPADELRMFADDPPGYLAARQLVVASRLLDRARAARRRRAMPEALALADRALALNPNGAAVRALVDELGAPRRGTTWLAVAVAVAAVVGLVGSGAWLLTRGCGASAGADVDAAAEPPIAPTVPHR